MTTYNSAIPQPTDLISNSQSQILGNFDQLNTQFAIDHTAFNTGSGNGDGFHKKVTLATKNTPGAQTDPSSAIYSASGTASTVAELFYKNQNATYPLSHIKAWGVFSSNTPSLTQTYNVTSITRSAGGQYTVTLASNAVSSATFGVLATCQMQNNFGIGGIVGVASLGYGGGVGTFQINVRSLTAATGTDEYPVTFVVLQA